MENKICGHAVYRLDLCEQNIYPEEIADPLWIELLSRRMVFEYSEPKNGEEFDDDGHNIMLYFERLPHEIYTLPAYSIDFDLY